jgi:hypothetical protein
MELLFSNEALLAGALMFLIFVIVLIDVLIYEDTPASVVIFAGICLIGLAGGALYYLDIMSTIADKAFDKKQITKETYDNFKKSSHIFLYLFPFVSAAIGTNLISDAITKNLHYKKKLTLSAILSTLWEMLKFLCGLVVLIPLVSIIVPPAMLFSFFRERKELIFKAVEKTNRFTYLKMLKVDILLRNFLLNKTLKQDK